MLSRDWLRTGRWHALTSEFRILAVDVLNVTQTTATIRFTASEVCQGQVEYGLTSAYGSTTTLEASFAYSTHTQGISGLVAGTTYHFRVKVTSQSSITLYSADATFTTQGVTVVSAYGPRPAPARPTGSNVYTVPSSIPSNDTGDQGGALTNWLNTLPAGSIAILLPTAAGDPSGYEHGISTPLATFRCSTGMQPNRGLTLWGYGVKLDMIGDGGATTQSAVRLANVSNVKMLGFEVKGANTAGGTINAYRAGAGSVSMGMAIYGGASPGPSGYEMADCWVHHVYGDGYYTYAGANTYIAGDHWVHHNLIEKVGRQGIVANQGVGWIIEWNKIWDVAMSGIDSEDARQTDMTWQEVDIRDNWFRYWNWHSNTTCTNTSGLYYNHAIAVTYQDSQFGQISQIRIDRNKIDGGIAPGGWGSSGCDPNNANFADIYLNSPGTTQPKDHVYVRNNVWTVDAGQTARQGVSIRDCDVVVVTGNTIQSQTLYLPECTNITEDWP